MYVGQSTYTARCLNGMFTVHIYSSWLRFVFTVRTYSSFLQFMFFIQSMFTVGIYSSCLQCMFIVHVIYGSCLQFMPIVHVCSSCLRFTVIVHVYKWCITNWREAEIAIIFRMLENSVSHNSAVTLILSPSLMLLPPIIADTHINKWMHLFCEMRW